MALVATGRLERVDRSRALRDVLADDALAGLEVVDRHAVGLVVATGQGHDPEDQADDRGDEDDHQDDDQPHLRAALLATRGALLALTPGALLAITGLAAPTVVRRAGVTAARKSVVQGKRGAERVAL